MKFCIILLHLLSVSAASLDLLAEVASNSKRLPERSVEEEQPAKIQKVKTIRLSRKSNFDDFKDAVINMNMDILEEFNPQSSFAIRDQMGKHYEKFLEKYGFDNFCLLCGKIPKITEHPSVWPMLIKARPEDYKGIARFFATNFTANSHELDFISALIGNDQIFCKVLHKLLSHPDSPRLVPLFVNKYDSLKGSESYYKILEKMNFLRLDDYIIELLIIYAIEKGNLEIFEKAADLRRVNLNKSFPRCGTKGSLVRFAGVNLEMIKALIKRGVPLNGTIHDGCKSYNVPLYLLKYRDPHLTEFIQQSLEIFTLQSLRESLNTALNDNLLADLVPILLEMILNK